MKKNKTYSTKSDCVSFIHSFVQTIPLDYDVTRHKTRRDETISYDLIDSLFCAAFWTCVYADVCVFVSVCVRV
jgi:hypothetical protein